MAGYISPLDTTLRDMLTKVRTAGHREATSGGEAGLASTFKDVLADALDTLSDLQANADKLTEGLATGEVTDVHKVMAAVEQVNIALQLTVQIRNKVIEAYQEVMRMQV